MSNLHVKYLLVGGGLASFSAAQAIRERDAEGSILLVGLEINRPYHRPPLSKAFLRREVSREELFVAPPRWFDDHRIELRTGRRVSRLDLTRGSAALETGEEVSFDRLLLATGATPAALTVPGATLPNLFTVRALADVTQLHHAIDKAKLDGLPHPGGRGRAAVIGAGLLGVEIAASLTGLGVAVDLFASRAHPWNRFAGESVGGVALRLLESRGVAVHRSAGPARLEGDGRVQRVVLADGRAIRCDVAVAAVGTVPNKELLRGTPVAAEKAILVDESGRTNVPSVYAAGDCCAVRDPLFGKYRWMDHWESAVATGTLAGHNMAGANETYGGVNFFSTEVFGLTVKVWGEARFVDRRLVRGTPGGDAPDVAEIGVAADGRVAQVVAVSRAGEDDGLRELVARRFRVVGNEERVKDPAVPLENLFG